MEWFKEIHNIGDSDGIIHANISNIVYYYKCYHSHLKVKKNVEQNL